MPTENQGPTPTPTPLPVTGHSQGTLTPTGQLQLRASTNTRLRDPEQCEELFTAIVEEGGIKPAARALGMHAPSIFLRAKADAEFSAQLRAAQATNLERLVDECITIADQATKHTWAVDRLRIETRMRLAGKLIPAIYGDRPATTEINLGVAVGVISDEKQRARLIDLRGKLSGLRPGHGIGAGAGGAVTGPAQVVEVVTITDAPPSPATATVSSP